MSAPKEIWIELLLGEICTTPPSSLVASRYARYILAAPEALADAPEVVALVEAAVKAERERVVRIAAALFAGGYDANAAKIAAALAAHEKEEKL